MESADHFPHRRRGLPLLDRGRPAGRRDRATLLSDDGHLWVGSGGVSELDGKRFRAFGAEQGLSDSVISIAEDRHGNIWMGTRTSGVRKLARKGLVTYGNGIGQQVTGFVEHPSGEVYAILRQGMLARYHGRVRERTSLNVPQKVTPEPYPDVLRDREGGWWVGSSAGLYRFPAVAVFALPGQAPTFVYTAGKELAGTRVARLLEDSAATSGSGTAIRSRSPHAEVGRGRPLRAPGRGGGSSRLQAGVGAGQSRGGRVFVGLQEGGLFRGSTRFAPLPAVDPKATAASMPCSWTRPAGSGSAPAGVGCCGWTILTPPTR